MNKSLLTIAGIALLAVPSLHAQERGHFAGRAARGGSAFAGRPIAFNHGGFNHGGYHNGSHYRGHGGYRGRYYYFGGEPFFYPFFDYGYGYPGYYGGAFGYGYAGPYYGGSGWYGDGPYEGRIVEDTTPENLPTGAHSLPAAVQRQLAKRGYYKGSIDGEFGDGSRSALRRFQRANGLKETGRIDEPSLQALGFSDHR